MREKSNITIERRSINNVDFVIDIGSSLLDYIIKLFMHILILETKYHKEIIFILTIYFYIQRRSI